MEKLKSLNYNLLRNKNNSDDTQWYPLEITEAEQIFKKINVVFRTFIINDQKICSTHEYKLFPFFGQTFEVGQCLRLSRGQNFITVKLSTTLWGI